MLILITWLKECLSSFSIVITPPPSFHSVYFRRKSLCTAHTQGVGSFILHHLESKVREFGIDLPLHPYLFIYLFTQQFIYINTNYAYLFCSLGYNSTLHYVIAQIVQASAVCSFFRWLCVPLACPHHCCGALFVMLSTYLLSVTTRCSRLILYIPCPGPRISQDLLIFCFTKNENSN